MGTRNLTMVILDKETKVAQYGQWDGYPGGQGATILTFLRECNMKTFNKKIKELRWLTKKEIDAINPNPNWKELYPYLSRDVGGEILEVIYTKEIVGLMNQEEFAKDSLFCEWAYVIDLDKKTLEVYCGFNQTPLKPKDRFYGNGEVNDGGYYPVRLLKSYSLTKLPTVKKFVSELEKLEEKVKA